MENTLNIRRTVRRVIKIACILLLVSGLVWLGFQLYADYRRSRQSEDIRNMYYGLFTNGALAEEQPPLDPEQPMDAQTASAEVQPIQDDFAELFGVNEHLVGWLECGEAIALPVVHLDNEFYLSHDFYGEWDDAGTVFINEANTIWPADRNILFHGHNMRSGAAFGNLDNFRDIEYLKQNPLISWRTIYDEEPVYYVPVALFDASMEADNVAYFDIGRIWFNSDDDFMEFANSAIDRTLFALPFDVQADDMLITLITCSYEYDNSRFIIVARALRQDETPEQIMKAFNTLN